ncbi:MAG TPA: hypothetical protein VE991_06885 [Acidimicrobiales bacterium]|nr:hypothetical protein [Acidimicrobiales bacterium]
MTRVALRQLRTPSLVALVGAAALVVVTLVTGHSVVGDYRSSVADCAKYGDCGVNTFEFLRRFHTLYRWLDIAMLAVPGLLGVFWGAPLVARELETGTFRLAWTQSVMRRRWLSTRLGVGAAVGLVVTGVVTVAVVLWASTIDRVFATPFATFDQRGVVPLAYLVFAFALGVLCGVVIRRTVPAMFATLVGFVAARVVVYKWVRPHLLAPLVRSLPYRLSGPVSVNGPGSGLPGNGLSGGDWIVSDRIYDAAGRLVGTNGNLGLNAGLQVGVSQNGVVIHGVATCSGPGYAVPFGSGPDAGAQAVQRCVDSLHLTETFVYQPPNHYWPIQGIESAIFVAAALVLALVALWWVRRRLV